MVDHHSLLFDYHKAMVGSLALVQRTNRDKAKAEGGGGMSLLIVGLGGGALSMFLRTCLSQVSLAHSKYPVLTKPRGNGAK